MVEWIQPGKTIGIVGGGSIARLLALAAKKLGYNVGILDPDRSCPAKNIADWYLCADLSNADAFRDLSMKSDVVIYEMEAFDSDFAELMKRTVPVPQGGDLLSVSQDRVLQKAFLESVSINIAPFSTIVTIEDIEESVESIGYPCVLKTNRVDERFKQHYILYSDEDIQGAKKIVNTGACVLEAWIPKERELCVAIVKGSEDSILTYPVTETVYRNDVLYQAITPARIHPEMEEEVKRVARTIAGQIDFAGVIAVELFATSSGSLYVNELVAHPHEAYHYTVEGTNLSQYEAHIRAVCGMALPNKIEQDQAAIVVPFHKSHLEMIYYQAQTKPDWIFTFYPQDDETAKEENGHITILTENISKTLTLLSDIDLWSINKD